MDDLIEGIMWIIMIGFIVLIVYALIQKGIFCNANPQDESCIVEQKQPNTNNNSNDGIKCGWVFGDGFKCGIGF